VTLGELADEFEIDVPTASGHVAALLREGLATDAGRGDSLSFWLTPRGRDRLYRERAGGPRSQPRLTIRP
jgi:predicted transcriptional regulator